MLVYIINLFTYETQAAERKRMCLICNCDTTSNIPSMTPTILYAIMYVISTYNNNITIHV